MGHVLKAALSLVESSTVSKDNLGCDKEMR